MKEAQAGSPATAVTGAGSLSDSGLERGRVGVKILGAAAAEDLAAARGAVRWIALADALAVAARDNSKLK